MLQLLLLKESQGKVIYRESSEECCRTSGLKSSKWRNNKGLTASQRKEAKRKRAQEPSADFVRLYLNIPLLIGSPWRLT
eukprot:scaffold23536_cov201-Cylindrotheca_fusiformis.AAC.1